MLRTCDRCGTVTPTVRRSKLPVEGLEPRGRCGCHHLCRSCRTEIINQLNRAEP